MTDSSLRSLRRIGNPCSPGSPCNRGNRRSRELP